MMATKPKSQLWLSESRIILSILNLVNQPFNLYKSLISEHLLDHSLPQKDVL